MYSPVEEHNTNQEIAESLKTTNDYQKQEIACLTEELELIKSSVAYLQVESKDMSSENNIAISKVQNMQGEINTITVDLMTRINKEES